MLSSIPPSRGLLYICALGSLPFLYVVWLFFSHYQEVNEVKYLIEEVRTDALVRERKQALNMAVRDHFKNADHFYIDKHLENLVFLEPEIEALQNILQKPDYAHDEQIKKRFEFLTSNQNALVFTEGVVQSTPSFQEVTETLAHPVEVNGTDIKRILSLIEGVGNIDASITAQRPQLIITELRLERKKTYEKNEVFLLNLKLVKREFTT